MPQAPLPFDYVVENGADRATAWGGLPLVAEVLTALGVDESVRRNINSRGRDFDAVKLIRSFVLLMAAGGDCFDDIRVLREDAPLIQLLGHALPSAETLRQFLYGFHDEALVEAARQGAASRGEASFVPEENAQLSGLGNVMRDFVAAISNRWSHEVATLDIDATIQESHKREAKAHYLNGRGYQPVVAVWAEADVVVADEFRDGNVPAQKDVLGLLKRAFAALPRTVKKRRLRGDSALHSTAAFRWLADKGIEFAVGAPNNPTFRTACAAIPETTWQFLEERSDSVLHVADVDYSPVRLGDRPARYIAVRLTPKQQDLIDEELPTYFSIATNRTLPAAELARWYWEKAGTIEQVHGVVKNELGGGVLPCGRFGANAAWFRLALLTYNALRVVRLTSPPELREARPKRLRLHLLAVPAIVANHARRLCARIARRAGQALSLMTTRATLWATDSPGAIAASALS